MPLPLDALAHSSAAAAPPHSRPLSILSLPAQSFGRTHSTRRAAPHAYSVRRICAHTPSTRVHIVRKRLPIGSDARVGIQQVSSM